MTEQDYVKIFTIYTYKGIVGFVIVYDDMLACNCFYEQEVKEDCGKHQIYLYGVV